MIGFTDITESIYYIRGTSEQKATTERILIFLRKKDQYRDLSGADLEEEINTLVTTGLLFKNDKNSEIRQMHQQTTKIIILIVLTTILMMKQVKMKIFLH